MPFHRMCCDCNEHFHSSQEYNEHRKGLTAGRTALKCYYGCGPYGFCNTSAFQQHMDALHPIGQSLFETSCEGCSRKFASKAALSLHRAEGDCSGERYAVRNSSQVDGDGWRTVEHRAPSTARSSRIIAGGMLPRYNRSRVDVDEDDWWPPRFNALFAAGPSRAVVEGAQAIHNTGPIDEDSWHDIGFRRVSTTGPARSITERPLVTLSESAFPSLAMGSYSRPGTTLRCNCCQRIFRNETGLTSHRDGAPNTASGFPCGVPTCNFTSCSASALNNHRQSTGHRAKTWSSIAKPGTTTWCPKCSQLIRRADIAQHEAEQHPSILCHDCNERFDSDDGLLHHHASGSPLEKEVKIKCPCGETFAGGMSLLQHIFDSEKEPGHGGFCFHCELVFESRADYLCHQDRMHDTVYPDHFLAEDNEPAEWDGIATSQRPFFFRKAVANSQQRRSPVKRSEDEGKVTLTCIICLGFPEKLTVTGCGHLYCNKCIVSSLKLKSECPICRKKTTTTELREVFI